MDDYDRKTAGMIGALLFALGMILIICMILQLKQYVRFHVYISGSGVLTLSTISLFLVTIGSALFSQADKKQ